MTARWADPFFRFGALRILLWFVIAHAAMPGVFDASPYRIGGHQDEHFFLSHEIAALHSIVEHHQWFAWNPYHCGGVPGIANPQDTSLSPDFLLRILFGAAVGRRLAAVLFLVLGMEGTYRLARRCDASGPAAAVAAIVNGTSGWYVAVLPFGWLNMFGFELLPWVILAYDAGLESRAWRVFGGAMLAWMICCGGTYTTPFAALALGVLAVAEVAMDATIPRANVALTSRYARYRVPFQCVAEIGIVAGALAAVRLVPMMSVVFSLPRVWRANDNNSFIDMFNRMFGAPPFAEENVHITAMVLVLGLFAVVMADRRAGVALVVAAFFFSVSLGDCGPHAPYRFIHSLPLFKQLRSVHRILLVTVLFVSLAGARGLTVLEDAPAHWARTFRRRVSGWPWVRPNVAMRLALGVIGTYAMLNWVAIPAVETQLENKLNAEAFTFDYPLVVNQPFRQSRGNRWDAQVWVAANLGSLQCFEETPFPQSPRLRGDLAAEEYAAVPQVATVRRLDWSPNEITLSVVARAPALVLVNQNYHRSWRTNVGTVVNEGGQLGVLVPAGTHRLVLAFRDTPLRVGLWISLLSMLAIAVMAARRSAVAWRSARARWRERPWW